MAISFIGASSVEANAITLPGSYQAGDLCIIYAFRVGSTTAPTLPAGWTSISSVTISGNKTLCAWKILSSPSDTSGVWANATGMACVIYRGVATNVSPLGSTFIANNNISTSIQYGSIQQKRPLNSWVTALAVTNSTTPSIATPPPTMTNLSSTIGVSGQYVVHDTNGIYSSNGLYPSALVPVGASIAWASITIEILAEQGLNNNYQFVKVGDGMSVGERIR